MPSFLQGILPPGRSDVPPASQRLQGGNEATPTLISLFLMALSLDRSAFTQVLCTLALRVPQNLCQDVLSKLRRHLLMRPRCRRIVEDEKERDKGMRLVLLSEELKEEALPEEVQTFLRESHAELVVHQFRIGYNYFTAEEALRQILPADVEVPTGFETVGHIAHLNLRDQHLPFKHLIGQVLLDKLHNVRTVVNKVANIENEYRVFPMEVLAGEENMETEVREHNARFKLNFAEVYWNSRLQEEHQRIVNLISPRETVCDMFAGVGPFAIPLAMKGCTVFANDLNPHSFHYLNINTRLNKVEGRVKTFNMDGREFIRRLIRGSLFEDHQPVHVSQIVMNLPATAVEFLDVFRELHGKWKGDMPTVHCYEFVSKAEEPIMWKREAWGRIEKVLGCELHEPPCHNVRDVSTQKIMVCVSFKLPYDHANEKEEEKNSNTKREEPTRREEENHGKRPRPSVHDE